MMALERLKMKNATTTPVQGGVFNNDPEFVRVPQIYSHAGLKRGLVYRKINDGTFQSVLIREPGRKHGIRLVYWPSVKAYLHRLLSEQMQVEVAQNGTQDPTTNSAVGHGA